MIALGVTGHRILTEIDKVTAGIDKVLRRIEQRFPGHSLTIISALAEGADRLAVYRALTRPDVRLVVSLPLPADSYVSDFKSEESRAEFLGLLAQADAVIEMAPAPTRDQAYEAAGDYVIDHSDVLIAVWDGLVAQGQGGTGAVVAKARLNKLPIAWVHAGNRKPGTLEATSLGAEQGKVTYERL